MAGTLAAQADFGPGSSNAVALQVFLLFRHFANITRNGYDQDFWMLDMSKKNVCSSLNSPFELFLLYLVVGNFCEFITIMVRHYMEKTS